MPLLVGAAVVINFQRRNALFSDTLNTYLWIFYLFYFFSALLYLNGDIDGGEFFFAFPNKTEQVSLIFKVRKIYIDTFFVST